MGFTHFACLLATFWRRSVSRDEGIVGLVAVDSRGMNAADVIFCFERRPLGDVLLVVFVTSVSPHSLE